mgnify:CR=1 FL=1
MPTEVPELTRSRARDLVLAGRVLVGGVGARPSRRLAEGDIVTFDVLSPQVADPLEAVAELPLAVIHADDALLGVAVQQKQVASRLGHTLDNLEPIVCLYWACQAQVVGQSSHERVSKLGVGKCADVDRPALPVCIHGHGRDSNRRDSANKRNGSHGRQIYERRDRVV